MIPLRLPHVLGVDAAGVVDEVGPGVTGVRRGDAVFGIIDLAERGGANAEYAVLAAWALKPDALSWEQAGGAAANVETATRALDRLKVTAGTMEPLLGPVPSLELSRIDWVIVGGESGPGHRALTWPGFAIFETSVSIFGWLCSSSRSVG